MKQKSGKVFFVGAGPGDPRLITVKGADVLKGADVIIYDRLVNDELLRYAKDGAELIYCGKDPNAPSISQEEIHHLFISQAQKGKVVVRLKGGDPAVFGRVGEEATSCIDYDIPYEIVPGVTAGVAAPAYAGIPLTHRDLGSSFAVVTGQQRSDGKKSSVQWEKLATSVDTLVFYMGMKNISYIQEQLIKHGRSLTTPVAVIQWGTYQKQETIVAPLHEITTRVEEAGFASPSIIVVGDVVNLHESLSWFENNPGVGKEAERVQVVYA
ncbi:uroporphyrinogen-III C-methyltransferase [Texcoconibacillus texcoconensis]|uniref:Uroporphyrinogen-III C-methyltransferase n=1 Tax=Texcoconibacillus texcoconensis TaxID=1095777 RepID=A0A840QLU0_9BACI|nr:uroporphyrinogen-III C-methyltransferase [Texcoconibacillus texcoconensis]MBB5172337.1 uroporphyrin-III C-methyltransferase [Texcoconibacillus texcoconensis]